MKTGIKQLTLIFTLVGFSLGATAEDNPGAIMLKGGNYTLDTTSQTILFTSATFEEDVESEFSLEYEYRINDKVGLGIEFISFTGNYTALSIPGKADHLMIMGNARRYFDLARHVKPFFGAGIGASGVDMSGPIIGNAGGLALQGLIGIEFPFDRFAAVAEYKYVSAEPEDDAGETVDMSGSGLFAGVLFRF